MTHPSPSTIAKRAFYEAMKAGGESEAMWIAAADAVVEECAATLESVAATLEMEHGAVAASHAAAVRSSALAVRALKVGTALNKEPPCQET